MKLFLVISAAFAVIDSDLFVNKNVEMKSFLGTREIRQEVKVEFKALKNTSLYYIGIPLVQSYNLALIECLDGRDQVQVTKSEVNEYFNFNQRYSLL
jgi:hypothetical protein